LKVTIPGPLFARLNAHLFQSDLEQGAFLFGQAAEDTFSVVDVHLVPESGWEVQLEVYLEMKDSERARIMAKAVQMRASVVDCHSHPGARDDVWFSPSDIAGINAFAQYAKWKLRGGVYVATVWGESSVDAVFWSGSFERPARIECVEIDEPRPRQLIPTGSWFREPRAYRRKESADER
jgi:hypothetical protein